MSARIVQINISPGGVPKRPVPSARVGKLGVEVERSEVRMHEGPLRVVGEHKVELHLHTDVNVEVTVVVESDEENAAS